MEPKKKTGALCYSPPHPKFLPPSSPSPSSKDTSKSEKKAAAGKNPTWTGSNFPTPPRSTTCFYLTPISTITIPPLPPPKISTTITTDLRANPHQLGLPAFVSRPVGSTSLPSSVEVPATPILSPGKADGAEEVEVEGFGGRLKVPEDEVCEDPIASGTAAQTNHHSPADSKSNATVAPARVLSVIPGSSERAQRNDSKHSSPAPLFFNPAPQIGDENGSECGTQSKAPTGTFPSPREEDIQCQDTPPNLSANDSPLHPVSAPASSASFPTEISDSTTKETVNVIVDVNGRYDAPPTPLQGSFHSLFISTDYQNITHEYSEVIDQRDRMANTTPKSAKAAGASRLTEKECNERWGHEMKQLLNENESLWFKLNDADEALRRCQQATSENPDQEVPRSHRSLREQIEILGQKLEKFMLDNETQEQLLKVHGVYERDGVLYKDLVTENKNLKTKLWSLETANKQLNEDFKTLQRQVEKDVSYLATPALTDTPADSVVALEKRNAELKESQKILRQANEELRHEIEKVKEMFVKIKKNEDALKENIRKQDDWRSKRLASLIPTEDPELTRYKEAVEEYEKEILLLKKQISDFAASFEVDLGESAKEVAELQGTVNYLTAEIARNEKRSEETESRLQVKIKALEDAIADSQRQIERQLRKIAELEGRDPGKRVSATKQGASPTLLFPDAPDTPIVRKSSAYGEIKDIPTSRTAMEVIFIRCEIQLGQLQAERRRWGFVQNDTDSAIGITHEAEQMAEHLGDSEFIGRAVFWRGVAEFMAGNSTAAEELFGRSNSHQWTKSEEEKELLKGWWRVSKTVNVNKTARSQSTANAPSISQTSWPEPFKQTKHNRIGKKDKKATADGTKSKDIGCRNMKFADKRKVKNGKDRKKKTETTSPTVPLPDPGLSKPNQAYGWWDGLCEKAKAFSLQ
jgi:hypothetical protein